ncbi:MAG: EAL domain-containing protein [Microvirga sp.]|nr:EAL domain-containing protein [Microvirga sp.]
MKARLQAVITALRGRLRHPATLPLVVAVAVICVAWIFAERQAAIVAEQTMRTQVLDKVSVIRASLEGNVNANIQLVRGLVGVIKTEPEIDQQRFGQLARNLFSEENQLRHVAAAPDLVVAMTFPLAGNEAAIGLDYRANPAQREAALRARHTGRLVFAGPVDLVQGGIGFVGRFPIFLEAAEEQRFWGIVSAVIDARRLYEESGLLDPELSIDLAILADGAQTPFYGDPAVLGRDPVIVDVALPSGQWRIAATPQGGWASNSASAWWMRVAILVAAALVILPIQFTGRLLNERAAHNDALSERDDKMRALSHRLDLALTASAIGIWEYDIDTTALFWDERMFELYDVPPRKEAVVSLWSSRIHPDDLAAERAKLVEATNTNGRYDTEFRIVTSTGEIRWIRAIGRMHVDSSGARRLVGVNWNVSRDHEFTNAITRAKELAEARNEALEQAKARIEHNALHDSLTGLPNRRYLDRVLEQRLQSVAQCDVRSEPGLAILHVDLDRFKHINDTLGHAAGDAMLRHSASVLRSASAGDTFVARVGGDEFILLCAGLSHGEIADLAGRIVAELRKPVAYQGHECRFGVSIGVAVSGCGVASGDVDGKRMMIDADIALYRAKKRGRNRYEFFTDALEAEIVHTKRVADEILRGLEDDQFVVFYQPQFDAQTHDIEGVEALVRWRHPTRGLLAPAHFMRVAEEMNVVGAIDKIVLRQGLRDHSHWRELGLPIPRLSVNVSARRLRDEELIEDLRSLTIEPGALAFELIESIFLDDDDPEIVRNIAAVKGLGIEIEIDDFGTGYASIVSLMKLQPNRLKIDRQFVRPIMESARQHKLVRSIIDIGRSLDIGVVAEGVESMEHANELRLMGCDILQGYAFARPMPAAELAEFVRVQQWRIDGLRDAVAAPLAGSVRSVG